MLFSSNASNPIITTMLIILAGAGSGVLINNPTTATNEPNFSSSSGHTGNILSLINTGLHVDAENEPLIFPTGMPIPTTVNLLPSSKGEMPTFMDGEQYNV